MDAHITFKGKEERAAFSEGMRVLKKTLSLKYKLEQMEKNGSPEEQRIAKELLGNLD